MLERIAASLSSLAPAEQRVAHLVLSDPHAFTSLPVRILASRAHVSKPAVVRFCRSMGYDGLADFKLKLAGSVSEGVPFIHRSVDADDKTGDVMVKVVDNAVAAFLQYRNAANTASLERAAQAIAATWQTGRRIEFYGAGNSGIVAQDAQHKFFRLGVISLATSDGHIQVMGCHAAGPGRLRHHHLQVGPHARPDGRCRHCAQERRNDHRHHRQRLAAGQRLRYPPAGPKVTTATAPWCRACCTCWRVTCWPPA